MKAWKEMSRLKKTCIYLILILLLTVFLLRSTGHYMNSEDLYRAYEKGAFLPPAEEIKSFPYGDRQVMMLGSGEYGIFAATAKQKYGLWTWTGDYLQTKNERYPVDFFYEPHVGVIYGSTWIEGASQIYFEGRYSEVYEKDVTGTAELDEYGCFILDAAPYEHGKGAMVHVEKGDGFYVELLDEEGTAIWKSDETTHWR